MGFQKQEKNGGLSQSGYSKKKAIEIEPDDNLAGFKYTNKVGLPGTTDEVK